MFSIIKPIILTIKNDAKYKSIHKKQSKYFGLLQYETIKPEPLITLPAKEPIACRFKILIASTVPFIPGSFLMVNTMEVIAVIK